MQQSLDRPSDAYSVALESSGAIIDNRWQLYIYAHLDAFLSATWSIPAIIQCCFGIDPFTRRIPHQMNDWWNTLSQNEKDRRQLFDDRFKQLHCKFRALPLGPVRHTIEHRSGVAPAAVTITGLYGVTYVGGPGDPVPLTETRQIDDPNLQHLAKPRAIHPRWNDFYIGRFGMSFPEILAPQLVRGALIGPPPLPRHGGKSRTRRLRDRVRTSSHAALSCTTPTSANFTAVSTSPSVKCP